VSVIITLPLQRQQNDSNKEPSVFIAHNIDIATSHVTNHVVALPILKISNATTNSTFSI